MNPKSIRLLILDVDGVLTDGSVTYGESGPVGKRFAVQDGCAIKIWLKTGRKVAIISGRKSHAVEHRARELGIRTILQGVSRKEESYLEVLKAFELKDSAAAFVGDDLPDIPPMVRCGFAVAVANAVPAVKKWSDFVTSRPGGRGAVAEVIELILRKQHSWSPNAKESHG